MMMLKSTPAGSAAGVAAAPPPRHRLRRRTPTAARRPPRALPGDDLPLPLGGGRAGAGTVQEMITIFTADGAIHRLPGRRLTRADAGVTAAAAARRTPPMPTWEEQALCIGASFAVSATNGRDPTRRVRIVGFCQSVDYLQEAVEDTVLSRGGEVLLQERRVKGGVHEVLDLKVAIPFLWGVPPEVDALSDAILSGGGIVDKVQKTWDIYAPLPPPPSSSSSAASSGFSGGAGGFGGSGGFGGGAGFDPLRPPRLYNFPAL